jgi:hypothetical protein
MKIIKRKYANPLSTISIWLIPTLTYLVEKSAGIKMNKLEWLWWVTITLTTTAWLLVNFKLDKNK